MVEVFVQRALELSELQEDVSSDLPWELGDQPTPEELADTARAEMDERCGGDVDLCDEDGCLPGHE